MSVVKSKLEFCAKITTPDGRVITRRVEEDIPDDLNPHNLDEFMSSFDDYERHALRARNGICKEITQAWLDEQAKKGARFWAVGENCKNGRLRNRRFHRLCGQEVHEGHETEAAASQRVFP